MDCDHKYLAYIKLFNDVVCPTFIAPIHSGTIYYYQSQQQAYFYVTDIQELAELYGGRIPIIVMPLVIGIPIKNITLGYKDILPHLNYVLDKETIEQLCITGDVPEDVGIYNDISSYTINMCIILWTYNINMKYIISTLAKFPSAEIILVGENIELYASNKVLTCISISINNHMEAYIQGLSYIYNKNLKYDYIFKLYCHTDFCINHETLRLKFNDKSDVIGYPAIKYDYLDNNYVFDIIQELSLDKISNYNINTLLSNIKTLYKKFKLPDQVNRKTKEWAIISKKTNKSYIPSSIFISKFDKIPFEIIDCYSNIYNYNNHKHQNYSNAINKILSIFEN